MAESNSTQKKTLDNVEKRLQFLTKRWFHKDRYHGRLFGYRYERSSCLSLMKTCLQKWRIDRESDGSCVFGKFYMFYKVFLGKDPCDTENISSISAFYTSFINTMPLMIKELEAELAKKENTIKSLQEDELSLLSDTRSFEDDNLEFLHIKIKFTRQIQEEEDDKIQIQELIQTLEDTFPAIFENRRLRSKLEEKELETKNLVAEKDNDEREKQKLKNMVQKKHMKIQKLMTEKDHLKTENQKLENMVQESRIDNSRETETAAAMEMQKRNEPSTIAQQATEDDDGRVVCSGQGYKDL